MDTFDTPRLRLRPLQPADEALYCALYTDPAVMTHIGPPQSPEAAGRGFSAARLRNADPDCRERRWAVLDRASGEVVGLLALLRDPQDAGSAELGVMLLPAAQGRGFARELNDAVAERAFAPGGWGLHRVWARHAPGHGAAAGALGASGFQPGPDKGVYATVVLTKGDRA